MKIQIVGVGVVGTAQAYLASQLGHEVLGFDYHKSTSEHARMLKNLEREVDLTFICTPEMAVEEMLGKLVQQKVKGLYVIKSTVPPKTTRRLMDKHSTHICHNPEFLKEKIALDDVIHPNMVVIGQCCAEHGNILKTFYQPLGCPLLVTEPTVSETVKLTINCYLSTLISFWNEINKVASAIGVRTEDVAGIAKFNPRVSGYGTEFFGSPFGGKCLPKDLDQMITFAHQAGVNPELLEAIRDFNKRLNVNTV